MAFQWLYSFIVAVPLNPHHPDEMLEYFLRDSESSILITTSEYAEKCQKICEKTDVKLLIFDDEIRKEALVVPEETSVSSHLL